MDVIFFYFGMAMGVISFFFGTMDWRESQRGITGAACGFAVFAGLCFVATAIVYASRILAERRSDTQEPSRPGDKD